MTRTLAAILVVLLVAIAGCAGSPAGGPDGSADTPAHTEEPTATGTNTDGDSTDSDGDSTDSDDGTVDFYVSDEPNAIGDFAHLNVTITTVGFERAGGENDSGGWIEHSAGNRTVDLTELQGANASLVGTFDLPAGEYTKVFAYVSEVNATLANGESVRVKLPSEKLQVNRPFSVESNSSVQFVFDIAVHEAGKSGKYVLKPVIGESGTDVPIEDVDGETGEERKDDEQDKADDEKQNEIEGNEGGEAALNATFVGNVTAGENATLEVTRNGTAVENATVTVNEEVVGTTGADGTLTFAVPDAEELTVKVQAGEAEVELEVEVDGGG